jgi:predicted nuclease of predicted toxin-antitoxin system
MRLLADENFPGAAVDALRDAGQEVVWVRTASPGTSDVEVLAWAAREGRVLLTFDKDFGEIARSADLPATFGVVLFRIVMPPADIGHRLAALVMSRDDWIGHFSVVEPGRVRMRPLS